MTDKDIALRKTAAAVAIDAHIGERLRILRTLAGLSQSELAHTIGVTYQQLQKYEYGRNRISACQIYLLARALAREPAEFFHGLDGFPLSELSIDPAKDLGSSEAIEFLKVLSHLDAPGRKAALTLAKLLAD